MQLKLRIYGEAMRKEELETDVNFVVSFFIIQSSNSNDVKNDDFRIIDLSTVVSC